MGHFIKTFYLTNVKKECTHKPNQPYLPAMSKSKSSRKHDRKSKNIIAQTTNVKSMFADGFTERHDLEQYFWTENTVNKIRDSLKYIPECCCLTTPSLGHAFYLQNRHEVVLDIDTRFNYLPRFRYFDILAPIGKDGELFNVIVM